MINKIRKIIIENQNSNNKNTKLLEELNWANIYHDTIRGRHFLENLSLTPGRWAANYSFLFLIIKILIKYKPQNILEFGLGETSKLISSFISNEDTGAKHIILEQDLDWILHFELDYKLSNYSKILHLPLVVNEVKSFSVNSYESISKKINNTFDLYIVDGPFGSERYSRYDICLLAEKFNNDDEFIIILDDYNRYGEIEMSLELESILMKNKIKFYKEVFEGIKQQLIITTEKYKNAITF